MITCFQNTPQRYTSFNVATHTEMADPVLLKLIEQVTQSVRSKRHKLFEYESDQTNAETFHNVFASVLYKHTMFDAFPHACNRSYSMSRWYA